MLREAHDKGLCQLVAPALLLYEVPNALKKPPNLFSEEEVMEAAEAIFLRMAEIRSPDQEDVRMAIQGAFRYKITLYDAACVALAEKEKNLLITGDRGLSTKIGNENLVVFLGSKGFKKLIDDVLETS